MSVDHNVATLTFYTRVSFTEFCKGHYIKASYDYFDQERISKLSPGNDLHDLRKFGILLFAVAGEERPDENQ